MVWFSSPRKFCASPALPYFSVLHLSLVCSGLLHTEPSITHRELPSNMQPARRLWWISLPSSYPRTASGPSYSSYCPDNHSINIHEIDTSVTTPQRAEGLMITIMPNAFSLTAIEFKALHFWKTFGGKHPSTTREGIHQETRTSQPPSCSTVSTLGKDCCKEPKRSRAELWKGLQWKWLDAVRGCV